MNIYVNYNKHYVKSYCDCAWWTFSAVHVVTFHLSLMPSDQSSTMTFLLAGQVDNNLSYLTWHVQVIFPCGSIHTTNPKHTLSHTNCIIASFSDWSKIYLSGYRILDWNCHSAASILHRNMNRRSKLLLQLLCTLAVCLLLLIIYKKILLIWLLKRRWSR